MSLRALWIVLYSGAAAGCAGEAAEPRSGPPQIHFGSQQESLGEVPVKSTSDPGHEVRFRVMNRGLSPLHIRRLVSSCKCTRATASSPLLQPGESGFVSLFVSSSQAEESRASVEVHSNDPSRPLAVLRVSWRAVAPLEFDPLTLDFGVVRPNELQSRSVRVLRRGAGCTIAQVDVHPPDFIQAYYDSDRIRVVLAPGSASEDRSGYVTVHVRDCWRSELVIPVRWRVQANVEATPPALFVSDSPGAPCSKNIILSGRPEQRLEIERARFRRPETEAQIGLKKVASNRLIVTIDWRLPAEAGVHENEIVVDYRAPEQGSLVIPVAI